MADLKNIYCAEQIKIPPRFPYILKVYAKAAIRTQPYDLLYWTSAYFRALSNRDVPPVKQRLEYPPFVHPTGITPGYLKTLLNGLGRVERVSLTCLLLRWQGVVLPETTLFQILSAGRFLPGKYCNFYKFLATACGFLGENLLETMVYVCELLTEEPEGGSAMIPLSTFIKLYVFLAELDCSGECTCTITEEEEETKELYRPCGPSTIPDESTSLDSRVFHVSTSTAEETPEPSQQDICGTASSQATLTLETLHILKTSGGDARYSDYSKVFRLKEQPPSIKEGDKFEGRSVETQSIGRDEDQNKSQVTGSKSVSIKERHEHRLEDQQPEVDQMTVDDFLVANANYNKYLYDEEPSLFFGDETSMEEAVSEPLDDYEPIGLRDILRGICECQEPVPDTLRTPTPPPPDPFEEFLKRMKTEIQEDRLQPYIRVPGIGPPVSSERITAVGIWLADCGRRQEGLVGPRNIKHFLCPELEDKPDTEQDDKTVPKPDGSPDEEPEIPEEESEESLDESEYRPEPESEVWTEDNTIECICKEPDD